MSASGAGIGPSVALLKAASSRPNESTASSTSARIESTSPTSVRVGDGAPAGDFDALDHAIQRGGVSGAQRRRRNRRGRRRGPCRHRCRDSRPRPRRPAVWRRVAVMAAPLLSSRQKLRYLIIRCQCSCGTVSVMRPQAVPIGLDVSRTGRLLSRAFNDTLVAAGGSLPQWLVLTALKQGDHAMQRDVADAIGIEGATLTHHLNRMEDDGYVRRERAVRRSTLAARHAHACRRTTVRGAPTGSRRVR